MFWWLPEDSGHPRPEGPAVLVPPPLLPLLPGLLLDQAEPLHGPLGAVAPPGAVEVGEALLQQAADAACSRGRKEIGF